MTTENNKIIAEFMRLTIITDGISYFDTNYKALKDYSKDWNDLMEVVERIEETEIENNILMLESIGNMAKFIFDGGCRFLGDCEGETKIEAVYNAVVSFIEWYNSERS